MPGPLVYGLVPESSRGLTGGARRATMRRPAREPPGTGASVSPLLWRVAMHATLRAVAVLFLTLTASAADKRAVKAPPADQLAALQEKNQEATAAYFKAVEALPK